MLREPRFAPWLVSYRVLPFDGVFDLKKMLLVKQEIAGTLDADWLIRLDADEILHPYHQGESLREGITRLDAKGWDVINFDEFVFLPGDGRYVPDADGLPPLR